MQQRRVVITGIGMVTPLGLSRDDSWNNLLAGHSAGQQIQNFDTIGWPVRIACEVRNFQSRTASRALDFASTAAMQACQDAQISREMLANIPSGVFIGAGIGCISPQMLLDLVQGYTIKEEFSRLAAFLESSKPLVKLMADNHPGAIAATIAAEWRCNMVASTFTTACAAGAQALGHAYQAIRCGTIDVAIAGGSDSLNGEILLAGFSLLGVLSQRNDTPATASRPFDVSRDGFVAGEGAAILVLEERSRAHQRGARIYAEIVGYGESENAYRITDLPEDGSGAISAMKAALNDAAAHPDQIDCINTHGTGTEQNDRVEALAIQKLFYDSGSSPWITANKAQIGHLVAAAGAAEGAISALSLYHQILPPLINLERPLTDLKFVKTATKLPKMNYVLSNSFGFGGTNACLLFGSSA